MMEEKKNGYGTSDCMYTNSLRNAKFLDHFTHQTSIGSIHKGSAVNNIDESNELTTSVHHIHFNPLLGS